MSQQERTTDEGNSDEDLAEAFGGDQRMMKLMEIVMKRTVGSGLREEASILAFEKAIGC